MFFICIFFLTLFALTSHPVLAAQTFDMANPNNWNIRFDGGASGDQLGHLYQQAADLDGNGKPDLIISAPFASNSHSNAGSVYIIYDSILSKLSGKGNTIDLSNSSNWNVRFDGAAAGSGSSTGDWLGDGVIGVADLEGHGKQDLILPAPAADNNSLKNSGSMYVIYNSLFSKYSGTGNIVDLSTTSNFNIRIDGDTGNSIYGLGLSDGMMQTVDVDGDGKSDIITAEYTADNNSRAASGSVFVIYNTILQKYSGTGNLLSLSNSSNYNLRFDGATAGDNLSGDTAFAGADLFKTGQTDLVIGCYACAFNSRTDSGSLYIIKHTIFGSLTGTGHNIDLANSSNYNIRFDGASAEDFFSAQDFGVPIDLNGDGKPDIIAGSSSSYHGVNGSGSVYIIFNSLFSGYSGTGNNVDMANSNNWNIRFDGVWTNEFLGLDQIQVADFKSAGEKDLLISSRASNNSRTDSGSMYVVYSPSFGGYSGVGNIVPFSDTTSYNLRYDGALASDVDFESLNVLPYDLNGDGSPDLILGAATTAYNSHTNSGSVYLIYNFPHTITLRGNAPGQVSTFTSKFNIGGTVDASNSVTNIANVQYSLDSNNPSSSNWKNCTADDGSFNSIKENFTCQDISLSGLESNTKHTLYIRAQDTNGSYTAQSSYNTNSFWYGSAPDITNCPANWSHCISAGPTRTAPATFVQSDNNPNAGVLASNTTDTNDLYIHVLSRTENYLTSLNPKVSMPEDQGYAPVSDIYQIQIFSAFNGYPLDPTTNPYTIILSYDPAKVTAINNLKLAYYINNRWKLFPGQLVINPANHTIATVTKMANTYFTVVNNSYIPTATPVLGTEIKNVVTTPPEATLTPPSNSLQSKPVSKNQQPATKKTCFLLWCW